MDKLKENIVFINSILLQNPHKHHDLPDRDKKLITGSLYEIFQILLTNNEDCKYLQLTINNHISYIKVDIIGSEFQYTIDIIDPDIRDHFFILYNDFQQKLKKKIRKEKLKKIGI